jgi:type III restriction enzyme
MYKELADIAANRIALAITNHYRGEKEIRALLDSYNPEGSSRFVHFTTTREELWETSPERCHVNWAVYDSDWEAELCRVVESHPQVRAYVKNHNLGFDVPYRYGSETRHYRPDFIVKVEDGHGETDLLSLVVEIKGYRREDAKDKKLTMESYWIPGVNNLRTFGRWAFAEFTDVYEIESDFKTKVKERFEEMIAKAIGGKA